MSSAAPRLPSPFAPLEQLREGRRVLRVEAAAIHAVSESLSPSFCLMADRIFACQGSLIVTGMGKAGLIGRKLAATLASTGTPAHFLHPAEAVHGDLGCLQSHDLVLALSNSGESEEVCRLIPILQRLQVPLLSITAHENSTLGQQSEITIGYGRHPEADDLGLAPTVSTAIMLAIGDALALVLSRMRGFTTERFAMFHPAGSLGQQLRTVQETMRPLDQIRVATDSETIRDVFRRVNAAGRRTGAVILIDSAGRLTGLFTDSDLARLFSQFAQPPLDEPIANVMTRSPTTIGEQALLSDAVELLSHRKLSELPVVDRNGHPVGLIDITDVIGLMPNDTES